MTVYNDKYRNVSFDKTTKMLYQVWDTETEFMTDEEYRETSISLFELVKANKAESIFINAVNLRYMVSPETQDWLNQNILPKYLQEGIQKIAIVLPKGLFQQVSVKQTVTDNKDLVGQKIRMFDNEEEAREWIL